MAKIKISGDSMTIVSAIKMDDLVSLKKHRPGALKLINAETKDEVFAVCVSKEPSFTKAGAGFASKTDAGFASLTLPLPANMTETQKKDYVKDNYGAAMLALNEIENFITESVTDLSADFAKVEEAIDIQSMDA